MDIAALQNKKRELESRLAEMDEIKRDLEAIERVNRILNGTQNNDVADKKTVEEPAPNASTGYGDVLDTVKIAVKGFSTPFTSTQVHDSLVADGNDLNRSSIAGALRKLCEKGVVTMIEEGRGRRPSKYVNTQQTFGADSLNRSGTE